MNTSSGTPDKEEVVQVMYEAVIEKLDIVRSNATYARFKDAVIEITEAHQEACSGPEEDRPMLEDIPSLAQNFSLFLRSGRNGTELRQIYGKMLCLNSITSSDTGRRKRQEDCTCPSTGLSGGDIYETCQFFACINEDYETAIKSIFIYKEWHCLTFVVDTTGSMREEIHATRELIKTFISSEEDEPACYVVVPFNDHHALTDPPGPGEIV